MEMNILTLKMLKIIFCGENKYFPSIWGGGGEEGEVPNFPKSFG